MTARTPAPSAAPSPDPLPAREAHPADGGLNEVADALASEMAKRLGHLSREDAQIVAEFASRSQRIGRAERADEVARLTERLAEADAGRIELAGQANDQRQRADRAEVDLHFERDRLARLRARLGRVSEAARAVQEWHSPCPSVDCRPCRALEHLDAVLAEGDP